MYYMQSSFPEPYKLWTNNSFYITWYFSSSLYRFVHYVWALKKNFNNFNSLSLSLLLVKKISLLLRVWSLLKIKIITDHPGRLTPPTTRKPFFFDYRFFTYLYTLNSLVVRLKVPYSKGNYSLSLNYTTTDQLEMTKKDFVPIFLQRIV